MSAALVLVTQKLVKVSELMGRAWEGEGSSVLGLQYYGIGFPKKPISFANEFHFEWDNVSVAWSECII